MSWHFLVTYVLALVTYQLQVETTSSWAKWHAVTKFYDKGNMYIMDDGKVTPIGIIGPLKSIGDAGYKQYYSY